MKNMKSLVLGVALSIGSAFLSPSIEAGGFRSRAWDLWTKDLRFGADCVLGGAAYGVNYLVASQILPRVSKVWLRKGLSAVDTVTGLMVYAFAVDFLVYGTHKLLGTIDGKKPDAPAPLQIGH
ncbi:MAG: hypothetical protein LBF84_03435 [Holosporales bacterium]|jgi:hypothetical protein|nr:hypothetical protein [Holosporales bacterium]